MFRYDVTSDAQVAGLSETGIYGLLDGASRDVPPHCLSGQGKSTQSQVH